MFCARCWSRNRKARSPTTRPKTRMVPENYEFQLIGSEYLQGRPAYVIDAIPQRSDKYLFRGRIWVDAEDFAVARVEGQPAKNPSFWTRSVHFVQQYHKSGAFWFPVIHHQRHRGADLRHHGCQHPLFRLFPAF